ncbi:protein-tyrosine-phosphatase [Coemansia sp. BCRC 34301]|nr:protein-tyrosine-phosphatase [Coemansia sp. BCRC 34301]
MADIIDPLMPPYRFERVQSRLYRGGYPKPRNFRFLRRQRLKTIVSLIPDDRDNLLTEFCHSEGIRRIVIAVDSPNENVTVTESIVSRCLELVISPDTMPLYLHCLDGSNVTGVVIMCLRKLQLWRVASLQNEYLRFEQDGEIIPEESEFVEAYSGRGLVLPNPYAEWLWPGRAAADVNVLPFKNGTHPVVPHTRLRQRMSTDICQADPRSSQSRSATDLSLVKSGETSRASGAMGAAETFSTDRSLSEAHSARVLASEASSSLAVDSVACLPKYSRVDDEEFEKQSQAADQLGLHTSFSTGALPDMTHSSQQLLQRTPVSDAHEMLEPVLAALAGDAMKVATESSSKGSTAPGGTASSIAQVATDEAKGASSRNSGASMGASEGSIVKELALSLLVQALAIEGLGM